jgi:hypothetical protein
MGVINHDGAHIRKRTPNVIETIKKKRGRRPKMTETQKTIIRNSLHQGLDIKQIADLANVPIRAVHDMKYRMERLGAQAKPSTNGQ